MRKKSKAIVFTAPNTSFRIEQTGRGAVVAFSACKGRFDYVTRHPVDAAFAATPGVTHTYDKDYKHTIQPKKTFFACSLDWKVCYAL